ncbi:hypothetical protein I7I53_07975 [Histoplasma capsulatum var. duboisii H88]|uniref:Uncharacterized protein n=1 Tax=Ajellomyces capsulatus (strain H88) TaxID=544711 RepID=A0A8A1LET3_AJEC8|nr:hypothetical protein I7I53_07975 [Histoplasma capsulatum var. duboisii H88]
MCFSAASHLQTKSLHMACDQCSGRGPSIVLFPSTDKRTDCCEEETSWLIDQDSHLQLISAHQQQPIDPTH